MEKFIEYLNEARKYEEVFRNILRSMGKDEGELTVDEIYEKHSTGKRHGIWTILDFRMGPSNDNLELAEDEALFASEDIAILSGSGRIDKYKVKKDNSIEFDSNISVWMS